eukprot:CAMPEP_0172205782 /NCGR_PEP_ID=MMETSP1050-20130122/32819_1 /TAXON_ID=233186 /ORGANISM="Cryptomonas curvata, Strain CCAP979/52" /LENGTH=177 /DNA_ID=CAMNT_0012884723 /DNA_START=73 /DNA_END=602 /DNA_ORIENTATION=-
MPLQSRQQLSKSTTSSGAFFSASLDMLGNSIAPGAMLPSATMSLSSPIKADQSTTNQTQLPTSSPRRYGQADARSGSVVIWGSGWEQHCHQQELEGCDPTRRMCPIVSGDDSSGSSFFFSPQIDKEFEGEKILAVFGGFNHIFVVNDRGELIHSGPKGYAQQKLPADAGPVRQVASG